MIWKLLLCGTLGAGALVVPLSGRVPVPRIVNSPPAEPPGNIQPRPKRVGFTSGGYLGTVAAIGPDWVELAVGWEGERTFDREGRDIGRKHDNTKPKRVSAAGTIPGGDPNGEGQWETHWVSDLKVGDVVSIRVAISRNAEEWTKEILIQRRPGGKIPPVHFSPTDRLGQAGLVSGIHERNQAEQDWEEKGMPIPKRYLDPNGRAPWTNPPYPPVAPMPREVKK